MYFHIEHTTEYIYSEPAMEAFSEIRTRPRDSLRQKVHHPSTHLNPAVPIDDYTDYFGNHVETISIPFRHSHLTVTSICDVVTHVFADALSGLDLTLGEARQLYRFHLRDLHDFLIPSALVPLTRPVRELARKLLPAQESFATAIKHLNEYIYARFHYMPGATHVGTTVSEFMQTRRGVCQDFAHLMISLCRAAGIPARYVSGYIETDPPAGGAKEQPLLIGATASHAWVQIYTPNRFWVGLDPTNNILEGERHIQIGLGRDYSDVPPLKGIFKGARRQKLAVEVKVTRNQVVPAEENQAAIES